MHPNYVDVNVEKELSDSASLLRTIQTLLKIRKENLALSEGSLEMLENLPVGVLGFSRKFENEKFIVLLNFSKQVKGFQFADANLVFKLSKDDDWKNGKIKLSSYGGMILSI